MLFEALKIPDVVLVTPKVHRDDRGFFMETWRADLFAEHGPDARWVQDNHSRSSRGILRGLHYQIRRTQAKLVRAVAGEVFDVAVDLRRGSPYFGKWVGAVLSAENKRALYVPEGFAHGFYVMSDIAEITYRCSEYYSPADERTLAWNDPDIAVAWPIPDGETPVLSQKDRQGTPFKEAEVFEAA